MKIITIDKKSGNRIVLMDNDFRSNEEVIKDLTTVFESLEVVTINTSSGSLIIRPSSLESVLVEDNSKTKSKKIENDIKEDYVIEDEY